MKKRFICILDYGCGNVLSVYNLFNTLTEEAVVSNKPDVIKKASHIVLPGVGAFGSSVQKIKLKLPLKIIENEVFKKKKPFLGICVGMQVLANTGYEFGLHQGLGWIPGKVIKINSKDLPLPHVGWNNISIKKKSPIIEHLSKSDFYFVHSFIFKPKNLDNVIATTKYQEEFCSIIQDENIYGTQFHPEKSQKAGKILIENFLSLK
jgi:glutamine amidotransferase